MTVSLGMTGTAQGITKEIRYFYESCVVELPSHRVSKRREMADRYFDSWENKLSAIVDDIQRRVVAGQPVLVGTSTISDSQRIEDACRAAEISCQILNGVQDEEEAEVVASAGRAGHVCIATNMAGRGTDIKLSAAARDAGGLHVIGTQRHESRRVDLQLLGRSARQGDPGSSQFFVSADDPLIAENDPILSERIPPLG